MRIAFLGQKSLELNERGGGVERHVAQLAPRLVELGERVTVYVRPRYAAARPRYIQGVRVRYMPTVYTKHLEAVVHVFLSTMDILARPVDVAHYQGVGPALLCWLVRALRPRTTVVVTFHAQDQYHQKWGAVARHILRFGEWMACHAPHATIVVSHGLQVLCRTHHHTEAVFIPNGATTTTVRTVRYIAREGLKSKRYFLFVGRLLPVKGVQYLIRAFRRVRTDMALVVIGGTAAGEDAYVESLRHLASGDSRIRLLGFRPPEEVAEFYAHAYVYCQPSESEGLPMSVIEAMGHATAVLVSDIPGNLEAIHRTGFTFENKNVDDLARQIQHLVDHPDEVARAGGAVRAAVERYFNWDRIAEQTLAVYRTVRH